ncbi:hypothetical protein SAMD00019534_058790 [Acytostelium subglobosum LB1]|uniref:hypothetical protein n=1 Tax=Acytostelium subglobosum LB1 TaxID=1410327 RepID=UPI0006451293|nr:hypothetical protein SAMD00019534_058790 [Acytostelium subglobosum LB1]GAM22704.1 hypothetical protein SAMD00019534_058790 [Acytostelium subglobosum LB1]|eukprot:XP_012753931.1 hypothetical protein SAMD00019534_058790 [Acytostelium subglobosum LB1]
MIDVNASDRESKDRKRNKRGGIDWKRLAHHKPHSNSNNNNDNIELTMFKDVNSSSSSSTSTTSSNDTSINNNNSNNNNSRYYIHPHLSPFQEPNGANITTSSSSTGMMTGEFYLYPNTLSMSSSTSVSSTQRNIYQYSSSNSEDDYDDDEDDDDYMDNYLHIHHHPNHTHTHKTNPNSMEIDSCYSGDPLVSEVLKDEREAISFMERRAIELENVEMTISTLSETREAIRKDIRLKRGFLKLIQRKKFEHIKTITNSYNNIATRYNLTSQDARSLTLILPEEVMLLIFRFLTPNDLCSGVCRVCRKWRTLAFDISLWRSICLERDLLDNTSFIGSSSSSHHSNNNRHMLAINCSIEDEEMDIGNNNNNNNITAMDHNNHGDKPSSSSSWPSQFSQQSPQIQQLDQSHSSYSSSRAAWGENWYVGEYRKDSNWRRGKYSTTVLRGHKEIVWSLLFEPETNTLISGSEDMTVKVWDCSRMGDTHMFYDDLEDSKKRCIRTLSGHKNGTICLGSTPTRLVSGSADGSIKIWDRFDGACIETIQTHSSVWCLQIVNGNLICGCVDGTMRVFDLNTTSCLRTLRGHTAPVRCLQAINHNGQELVVSGSYDKTIKMWDMDSRCINTIRAHTHKINCLQYDSGQLVSGSHDSLLKVWDMTGQLIQTLQGHENMIHCLQLRGNKLLSGSTDSTIKLWDLKTGTHVNTIKGQSAVCCLKFNDSKLITGYEDSTIKVFDFAF